jgi:hypothetical protein
VKFSDTSFHVRFSVPSAADPNLGSATATSPALNARPMADANAVYHATGIGVRSFPITLDKIFVADQTVVRLYDIRLYDIRVGDLINRVANEASLLADRLVDASEVSGG